MATLETLAPREHQEGQGALGLRVKLVHKALQDLMVPRGHRERQGRQAERAQPGALESTGVQEPLEALVRRGLRASMG
jgi:hypothetical protein